ncbi:ribosomal protein S6 kinase alpha-6-like [Oratosquilla oratoria]|uniref:ribosomal protein S6 kinase alpha-6-like n=1 Tax=Oratosquilla oratoria TaxID=337810 RepID=UPI003F765C9E
MIFQLFFALSRCFQELKTCRRGKSSPSGEADFGPPKNFASSPATLTDYETLLKKNEETCKRYNFASGWSKVRVLGEGGYGKVFLLRKKKTKIARKVVLSQPSDCGFSPEEIIHIQMSHPNVLKLYCWEQKANVLCMNLEYCSRGDIASNLLKLDEKDAKSYFKQLLDGVAYIHLRGIVHRDLKPENLLVTKEKVLKISDFGLADFFIVNGKEIRLSETVGTESYMPPEVLQPRRKGYLGPPVDLWACGVIFFKLMTKRKPWSRADPNDEEYKIYTSMSFDIQVYPSLDEYIHSRFLCPMPLDYWGKVVVGIYCFKMIFQLFFALSRCFQELKTFRRGKSSPSGEADFGPPENFASSPATLTDCETLLKKNEETFKSYNFASGWTKVRVLGEGGYGKVFLLRKKKTKIARKVVLSQPSDCGFSPEEIIHIQMSHPNVLKLYCWEQKANVLCMNLEYCSRGDVASNLLNLDEKDAKSYFKQLLDGVAYIHLRGIVHRDLKPENLLLTKEKVLKISDFGLADFFIVNGKEIRLSETVGTESYMAPEVLQPRRKRYLGPPVDLWACGVIFFKLMTKRKPWSRADPNDEEYRMWVENRKGLYKKDGWKELNKALRTLLNLLLEPNPTQRIYGWRRIVSIDLTNRRIVGTNLCRTCAYVVIISDPDIGSTEPSSYGGTDVIHE